MTNTKLNVADGSQPSARSVLGTGIWGTVLRITAVALLDAFAIWWLVQLFQDGFFFFGILVAVITIGVNFFYLREDLYPYRWFTPGLMLMILLVLYPTLFTLYVAFTNYRDGNLLTKQQALQILLQQDFAAEDAVTYRWTPYQNAEGDFLLLLVDGNGTQFTAVPEEPITPLAEESREVVGEAGETPDSIGDYNRISPFVALADGQLLDLEFGESPDVVKIPRNAGNAQKLEPLYTYDNDAETLTDNQTGVIYRAVEGTFTADDGSVIRPGYYVPIGFRNFQRLFATELFGGGEMLVVFVWTFVHAFLSVVVTFALGLLLAVVLNHELVPFKKILRSLILIPYAIPAFISVLVWRGLLEPNFGVVNQMLEVVSGGLIDFVPWRSSPFFARFAIILIQLWLGFPYMLLITTGALQGIPTDMYEAADVDGASPFVQFWQLTMPLLLVAVGPLLIASFAFNFNNFTVIQLYLDGRPPISTTSVAGYTDILITYTYEVAFSSGRGADFGYATAITIMIFILLSVVTIFNFQLTKPLEEISENV